MISYSPSKFLSRWPSSLQPVSFPDPAPELPSECFTQLSQYGLPKAVVIQCNNSIRLRFTGIAFPLATAWNEDVERGYKLGNMPADWSRFWHLGEEEYLQGGGWICIEEKTGRLVIIDLDQEDPIYDINSSLTNFYTTLALFLDWSETTESSVSSIRKLIDTLEQQQIIPNDELSYFWLDFLDSTLDSSMDRVKVSLIQDDRRAA